MKKYFLLILFFIFNSASAWDLTNFKSEFASPWTTSARNVLFVGGGLTLTVLAFEDKLVDPTQHEMANKKPLGIFSKFGDLSGQVVPNILYILAQTSLGLNGDQAANNRAIGMMKATLYASGVTTMLKYSVREPRPTSHDKNSFPSGHTTTAFAFSGYIYEEHGLHWGIPAFLLSSFVGASRINDNRHFLHDVLAGATIGLSYGVGISKLAQMKHEATVQTGEMFIVPLFDEKTKGIALIKEF